jgi:hypothetical protein
MPEYDPPNAFYTQISLPYYINPGTFIGHEGFHLKRITELSRCDYLWMDFDRKVVEIWGRERFLAKAFRMLKKRMDSFKESKKIVVTTWEEHRTVYYEIKGKVQDCDMEADKIFKMYPFNPYFTKMESKWVDDNDMALIRITRSDSSD